MEDTMEEPTGLYSLPNEILIHMLSIFPTRSLLPLATVSHRFHDLVLRILHQRLLHAASLKDHKLILECFHPSSKLSTPHLFCDYLGTEGLSNSIEGEGSLYQDVERFGRLGQLTGLYSHFRPVLPEKDEKMVRRRHPAGDVPGHPDSSTWFPGPSQDAENSNGLQEPSEEEESEEELAREDVNLESHELFSQLCTITNLVKVGPKRGLFLSCVNIGDGVIRIWRDWLAEQAAAQAARKGSGDSDSRDAWKRNRERMLWVDNQSSVGLRLRVTEKKDTAFRPILMSIDEEPPVSYCVEYEELAVRTTQLLLMVEESLMQEQNITGKAIVIGSFN